MWLSDAARLDALAAPTAERDVPARSVVLDLGGCRLAWIRKDFVGSALQIIFGSLNSFWIIDTFTVLSRRLQQRCTSFIRE